MPNTDTSDSEVEEYYVGEPAAIKIVPDPIGDSILEENSLRQLFAEHDIGENYEHVEYLDSELVEDEKPNLVMVNVSLEDNGQNHSNASDCVITAAYFVMDVLSLEQIKK